MRPPLMEFGFIQLILFMMNLKKNSQIESWIDKHTNILRVESDIIHAQQNNFMIFIFYVKLIKITFSLLYGTF